MVYTCMCTHMYVSLLRINEYSLHVEKKSMLTSHRIAHVRFVYKQECGSNFLRISHYACDQFINWNVLFKCVGRKLFFFA